MKEKHDGMIRAQIQFEGSQYQRLKEAAARRGVSMAQLVREGVEAFLADGPRDRWDDLFAVAGKYGKGGPREDVGREHDRYLDEAYEDWREST
ncbi:MAG TPA: ribbon-helix-helix domain-containing protein [Gemmatimonadota bacterium]|nr:ribbon-helix-helix domain-containing protein [Gemmatimonadota bacterium]